MTGLIIGGVGSIAGALVRLWLGTRQSEAVDEGVNQQKAKASGDAVQDAADSQVISGDVERMSDDELRNSPYANNRDR